MKYYCTKYDSINKFALKGKGGDKKTEHWRSTCGRKKISSNNNCGSKNINKYSQ